jgi:hypothetical protein
MALREYTDSTGRDWMVWSIAPRCAERRSGRDRRSKPGESVQPERRVLADRRRRVMDPILLHGWLCFESGGDRRRLTPVPPDWTECDVRRLQLYQALAEPARLTMERRGEEH